MTNSAMALRLSSDKLMSFRSLCLLWYAWRALRPSSCVFVFSGRAAYASYILVNWVSPPLFGSFIACSAVAFGRFGVVGVVCVIALARDVSPAILEPVLVGDVVDHWTFRYLETRIVLRKDVPEQLHRLQKFWRAQ